MILNPNHGSYRAGDVQFLVTPLAEHQLQQANDVQQKEKLIQSGQRHYSEMLSLERAPSQTYLSLFHSAFEENLPRLARDCLHLAHMIAERRSGPITLVSLLRAGTPIGVILKHLLQNVFGREVKHFSISIIRERGLDLQALQHILQQGCAPQSLVFVDGWTGKGGIGAQLRLSVEDFNAKSGLAAVDAGLFVLSDLAGVASCSASYEDYLIPSAILNSTVSGLISRSVLNQHIQATQFHGCMFYPQLAAHDLSTQFVDGVLQATQRMTVTAESVLPPAATKAAQLTAARTMQTFLQACQSEFGIRDINLIKPGIGEASRALLRRAPRRLLLRDLSHPACAHMLALAKEKSIEVLHQPKLAYLAVALIHNAMEA